MFLLNYNYNSYSLDVKIILIIKDIKLFKIMVKIIKIIIFLIIAIFFNYYHEALLLSLNRL